jgi:hypothetical protein
MSYFVDKGKRKWTLNPPSFFDEEEMIEAARDQLSSHNGSPMNMGRDAAVYDTLSLLPKMVLRLAGRLQSRSS